MIFLLSLFVSRENIAWVMRSRSHTLVLYMHIYEKKTIINTRENKASSNIRPRPWTKVSISKERKSKREQERRGEGKFKICIYTIVSFAWLDHLHLSWSSIVYFKHSYVSWRKKSHPAGYNLSFIDEKIDRIKRKKYVYRLKKRKHQGVVTLSICIHLPRDKLTDRPIWLCILFVLQRKSNLNCLEISDQFSWIVWGTKLHRCPFDWSMNQMSMDCLIGNFTFECSYFFPFIFHR